MSDLTLSKKPTGLTSPSPTDGGTKAPDINLQTIFDAMAFGYGLTHGGAPNGLRKYEGNVQPTVWEKSVAGWAWQKGKGKDRVIAIDMAGTVGAWMVDPRNWSLGAKQILTDLKMLKNQQKPEDAVIAENFIGSIVADAVAQGIPKHNIIVFGHSLVGIWAAFGSHKHDIHGLSMASPPLPFLIDDAARASKFVSAFNENDLIGNFRLRTRYDEDKVQLRHYGVPMPIGDKPPPYPVPVGSTLGQAFDHISYVIRQAPTLVTAHLLPAQAYYFNIELTEGPFPNSQIFRTAEQSRLDGQSSYIDFHDEAVRRNV